MTPSLCFSKQSSLNISSNDLQPEWFIPIAVITAVNKYSGYGAKAKLLAGWALEGEIIDGLEVVDSEDCSTVVTSIPHRDALLNRICAIGGQI